MKKRLLLFGGSGAIGGAVGNCFEREEWSVIAVTRGQATQTPKWQWIVMDPLGEAPASHALDSISPFDAVCWAQGINANDSVYDVDVDTHLEIYRANCLFNLVTLRLLLDRKLLADRARLCVISSIWQKIARTNKLSYSVSKAALQGFVQSASVDLAAAGFLINAILPGALDTPMTHQNLSQDQLRRLEQSTAFARLSSVDDVAQLAFFLCSEANTSTTGQFIAVDLGFSHARLL